ncbi:class I SAM-dependent methyltransferase [Candidatus Parcubacteria bacterium]|nr:class I SAM-dependent methyltransferase [Candidatus Parcubacteria bacterium]
MDSQPSTSTEKRLKIKEYRKLREIFDQKDETGFKSIHEIGIDYKTTEVGTFLATETLILYKLLDDLILNGFLDPKLPFLDAGSGDARVNHMAALHGVKNSIGIEYSPEIFEKSRKQTQEFEDAGIIEKGHTTLIQGDFTNVETYAKNGLDIKNINTFFNYVNGWKQLLNFIDKNSPIGVKMILIEEEFNISSRIIKEISKYKSIKLKETIKYIYYKDKDDSELLTPTLLKKIKEFDGSIENQHIYLDISPLEQFSIRETDYRVVTVYLFEKIS